MQVPEPLVFAVPIFVLFMIGEAVVLIHLLGKPYDLEEALASIGMGIGLIFFSMISKFFYVAAFDWLFQWRLFAELGPESAPAFYDPGWHLNHWWVWVLIFFVDDFIYYWFHRFAHEIRILWAGHVNHHSSQEFNLATAVRQGWWEIMYKYIFWLPLPLLGFHPYMVFIAMGINSTYQFFLHTETVGRLGPLELILSTPSHHRVHHSADVKYLDRNYGGVLIVWDRLFGTFQAEEETPNYGLVKNIRTRNPFVIATHELFAILRDLFRASSWRDRWRYLFDKPGWSHDGADLRSDSLRRRNAELCEEKLESQTECR